MQLVIALFLQLLWCGAVPALPCPAQLLPGRNPSQPGPGLISFLSPTLIGDNSAQPGPDATQPGLYLVPPLLHLACLVLALFPPDAILATTFPHLILHLQALPGQAPAQKAA